MKRDMLTVALVVVVGLFVLGAAGPDKGEVGRWQVVFGNWAGRPAAVLVDTATGATYWQQPGKFPTEFPIRWDPILSPAHPQAPR